MPSKPVSVNIWTCELCRIQESVTHSCRPVGWSAFELRPDIGGPEDYDDCRRMGYRDSVEKEICRDCTQRVFDLLERLQAKKPAPSTVQRTLKTVVEADEFFKSCAIDTYVRLAGGQVFRRMSSKNDQTIPVWEEDGTSEHLISRLVAWPFRAGRNAVRDINIS